MESNEWVKELSKAYDDDIWKRFTRHFTIIKDNELEVLGIPTDVGFVLVGLLGNEAAKNWIYEELEGLDFKKIVELVTSEQGIKAVKMFIIGLP